MIRVSCIIPTYNEELRIENVLRVVYDHPSIDEVIVVDDGSKDKTVDVVSKFKNVRLIVHEINKGKSAAINTGFKASQGEFVFFLDADLVGLDQGNISSIIEPIIEGKADVGISLRKNAPRLWHMIGIDYISGERVFKKSILENHIDEILTIPRFGLEVFLNRLIIKNGNKIKIVQWNNVESPYKYNKQGWYKGIKGDIFMMIDIFRTVTIFGPIYQIIKMRKIIVK